MGWLVYFDNTRTRQFLSVGFFQKRKRERREGEEREKRVKFEPKQLVTGFEVQFSSLMALVNDWLDGYFSSHELFTCFSQFTLSLSLSLSLCNSHLRERKREREKKKEKD